MERIINLIRSVFICFISFILVFTGSFPVNAEDIVPVEEPEEISTEAETNTVDAESEEISTEAEADTVDAEPEEISTEPEPDTVDAEPEEISTEPEPGSVSAESEDEYSITTTEPVVGMKVGESRYLDYSISPDDGTQTVTWNLEYAYRDCITLDSDGQITAVDYGYADIVATFSNGTQLRYKVYVSKGDPTSFSFDHDNYKVALEQTRSIDFDTSPWSAEYCGKKIVSSDPSVLRVEYTENSEYIYDSYVYVYGVSTGTVTLTVTADNGVTKSVEVEVVSGNFADWISSDETAIGMKPGESRQLTYTLSPETADEVPSFRLSYDTDIISVDNNGVVTANRTGSAQVIAELINGSTVYYSIYVADDPDSMSLSSFSGDYVVGTNESKYFYVQTIPYSAGRCRKHVTSSNPEIARVDNEWIYDSYIYYYGVSEGKATITIEADNGVSVSAEVEVIDGLAQYVNVSERNIYMQVGDTAKISYTLTPSTATEVPEFSVSTEYQDIISVDETGVITALKPGYAYVNLQLKNESGASVKVFVADSTPQSIQFKQNEYTVFAGKSINLADQLVYDPPGSKYGKITCTSSDSSIASVQSYEISPANLYINTYKSGEATITVTSENGVSASTKIKVVDGYASSISANNSSIILKPGETEELKYYLSSGTGDTSKENVTFVIISGSEYVSVDDGKVTALKPGRAIIEARTSLYYGLPDEMDSSTHVNLTSYLTRYTVDVTAEPVSLEFDKAIYEVKTNESIAGFVYSDSADSDLRKLTYTSSDQSIAYAFSGDQNFVIVGVSAGTAVITATAENGVSAQVQVVVSDETYVSNQYLIQGAAFNWLDSIKIGEEVDLDGMVTDWYGKQIDSSAFKLISGDPEILSVNGTVIKGVSPGSASLYITDKNTDGFSRDTVLYTVTVTDIDHISFEQSEYTVAVDDSIELRKILKTEPLNYTMQRIEFTASNPDVVSFLSDDNRMDWVGLSAMKAGDTVITASTEDGKTAQMTLHVVKDDPFNDLILSEETPVVMHKGYVKTLKLNGPSDAALKSYNLTSADRNIVSIINNTLYAKECGTTTITATLKKDNTKQLSIPVTVVDGDPDTYAYASVLKKMNGDKVTFEYGDEFTCYVGEQFTLNTKAQWTDQYGEEQPYNYAKGYETENNSIISLVFGRGSSAEIDPGAYGYSSVNRQYMALRPGTSRIYTAGNRYVTIHVVEPAASMTIKAPKTEIDTGETLQLSAEIESEIPVTDPVTWISSDTSVLTVDETGKVTGVSAGKATVTARAGRLQDSIEITVVGPLEAELITDDEIYAGEATVLKATATGGSAPYKYQFTAKIDGKWTTLHNGTESEYTYTFEKAGSYPVNVTVTDSTGARVKSQKTLTVTVRPSEDPLDAELILAEDVYATEPTVLKASATGGSAPYKYQFTAKIDGKWIPLQNGTESECTYTFEKAGSYPVNVTVTDSTGTRVKSQKTLTVTVRPSEDPLDAELILAEDVYAGEATVLKAVATGGSAPYKYQFTAKIDGKWTTLHNGTESECTYTFEKAGSYPVNVTVTDSAGARVKSQKTLTVTVRPSEDPLVAELIVPEEAYVGEETALKAVATGGSAPYKYQFTAKIDGKWTTLQNGTESECTYTFEKAGSYPVNVTVTDSTGARVKSQKTLRVLEP